MSYKFVNNLIKEIDNMPYKMKSNEEITKAFDRDEEKKLQTLQSNIIKTTHELRQQQKEHKSLTGKRYLVF